MYNYVLHLILILKTVVKTYFMLRYVNLNNSEIVNEGLALEILLAKCFI